MARNEDTQGISIPSRFGRVLAVGTVAVAAIGFLVTVAGAGLEGVTRWIWPFAFVSYAAWAVFWLPTVTVSDGGVTLRNVLRTIHLPWPSIQGIDTKYALTLVTQYGKFAAWAAPAPTRYSVGSVDKTELGRLPESTYYAGTIRPGDNPASDSGQAALIVRTRWEHLRDAGHLDDARLERERPAVRWHIATIVTLVVLLVATAVAVNL